ncbi:MAG: transcriptional regulator [Acidobacteria bacterium]|nr:transcriptional regulator [Acidobacteriota bacterium]MCL5288618.1 transcriptional regulator [Acidobacteriota bacterium]
MVKLKRNSPPAPGDIDQLIHERLRLGIVCALAVHDSLTFTELRDLLQTTDGNLSVQARKLEEAGYVTCQKRFEARKPKTTYKLTAKGRAALEDYLKTLSEMLPPLEQLRHAARESLFARRPLPSEG